MLEPALRVGALFMAHDHDRAAMELAEPADDRKVLAEIAVAAERSEIHDQLADIVHRMRALGMSRDLGLLPGIEVGVGFFERELRLLANVGDFLVDGNRGIAFAEHA